MWDLTYALAEEIGDPDLFVGRKQEMARLLKWADGTKRRISRSIGGSASLRTYNGIPPTMA